MPSGSEFPHLGGKKRVPGFVHFSSLLFCVFLTRVVRLGHVCYDQFLTLTKLQEFRVFLSISLEILSNNYDGLRFLSSRGSI